MVNPPAYVPQRGDVIWLAFNPQAGHEEAGRRPALVLSPEAYNDKTSLAVMCPVTSQVKGYPFEVKLPSGFPVTGVILSDQVKNLDWWARKAEFACRVPNAVIDEVTEKLGLLIITG